MDHQATTPIENSVLVAMSDYWEKSFGNPHSNGHVVGWKANAAISKAASNVATLIGAETDEVIFSHQVQLKVITSQLFRYVNYQIVF